MAKNSKISHKPLKIHNRITDASCSIVHMGEMAEWSNAAVLKTVVPSRVPWVRIPVSPNHRCLIRRGG